MMSPTTISRAGTLVCRRSGRTRLPPYPRRFPRPLPNGRHSSASATPVSAASSSDASSSSHPKEISPVETTLALSVYFRHPDLGMTEYEILSRATAFLLRVDPLDPREDATGTATGKFPHLRENADLRKEVLRRQDYAHQPASGVARLPSQLGWLEFCPVAFRPRVHVVSSGHVIGPWLWPKYYGQDWLKAVTQDHVRYSLEVWGGSGGSGGGEGGGEEGEKGENGVGHHGRLRGEFEPVAKFELNPYPIHHPGGMDLAVIHLKEEEEALRQMTALGVRPLVLSATHELEASDDPVFEPGERVLFQGFEVREENAADGEAPAGEGDAGDEDDERSFHPYSSLGVLEMASPDRFLARTGAGPLPEGLCGGPAIRPPGDAADAASPTLRGVVEGIVPTGHENAELAGLASFLPPHRVREFVDYAERAMLEQVVDEDLFKRIVELKEGKGTRGGTTFGGDDAGDGDDGPPLPSHLRAGIEGTGEDEETPHIDRENREILSSLRKNHTPEEVDAILATVEREREEVVKIMESEGGDMDDVIAAVRRKTYEEKDRIVREIEGEMAGREDIAEGEIVPSEEREKS